jgi:sulfonate transport system substrate-binding protein
MRISKTLIALTTAAASAVALTGCAGNPAASGGGSDGTTIRYVDTGDILASYPRLQSEVAGYFADEGITIDNVSAIANANQIVQTVANGQVDMALTGGTGPLAIAKANRSVKVVAVVGAPAPLQIALNNDALARLARDGITPKSPYREKIKALKGFQLATYTTGSTTDLLMREALSAAGYETDTHLTLQPFTDAAALTASAREGATDGLIAFPNQSTTPAADGWGEVFIDFQREAKSTVDIPYIVVIANPDFLGGNRDLVKKFLVAMTKARDDAKQLSPEQGAAIKKAYFGDMSDAAWTAGLDAILPAFSNSIVPTEPQFEKLLEIFNRSQDAPVDIDFDALYDVSIVKEIPGA